MTEPKKKKRKSSTSPTSRTLKYLRDRGWTADVVERWIPMKGHPGGGQRKDLFGFGDVFAVKGNSIAIFQVTSDSGLSSRVKKIESEELAEVVGAVRKAGIRIICHGWRKKKVPGTKLVRWSPRIVDLS